MAVTRAKETRRRWWAAARERVVVKMVAARAAAAGAEARVYACAAGACSFRANLNRKMTSCGGASARPAPLRAVL